MDLRIYKKELRSRFKQLRREMDPLTKQDCDERIFTRVIASKHYRECRTLLTYVSTEIEVDTHALAEKALADGKTLAVPKCMDEKGIMNFYVISGRDDLEKGKFSLSEPRTDICEQLVDFGGTLCIVPGLAFDMNGYRLGYGGGYYDRFLSGHPEVHKMGICYCCCTIQKLNAGYYDSPTDTLVTEKYLKTFG